MADNDPIQFDRRSSDVNVESLALRMKGLEGRIEVLENDLKTNTEETTKSTAMTKEVHEAVFGIEGEFVGVAGMTRDVHAAVFGEGDKPGLQALMQNISEILEMGRSFFRGMGRVASGAGKASDFIARSIKRFWWVIATGIAIWTYLRTGKWELPMWPG